MNDTEQQRAVGSSAWLGAGAEHGSLIGGRRLSVLLTDEISNESVRVEIGAGGLAGVTGRGNVLNWFCDQLPHFRGLLADSLPYGGDVYVRVADAQNNGGDASRRYRAGDSASPSVGEVRNG